ncbi:MAG: cbb3-type cytochrome oxidase assembly protein CcoS [Motiliproteus sp.]
MEVIYGLIPGMILMGLVGVGVFFWAAKSGQYDDLQGEAHRILMDDDLDDSEVFARPDPQPGSGADSPEPDAPQRER